MQRKLPAFRRFHSVCRTEDIVVRNGAQCGEMFDRLMGRAVFAKTDGIMRHHIDDANAHQRGKTHGRTRIIGEAQEGAGIGDQAAMQRDAVHRCSHAKLADAVMDITAIIVFRRDSLGLAGLGVVGAGKVGRAAYGFRHDTVDDFQRHFGRLAGGNLRLVGGKLLLVFDDCSIETGRQLATHAALEFGAGFRFYGRKALFPFQALLGGVEARDAPGVQNFSRNDERFGRPAQRLARGGDFFRAKR
ncbi:Uncharacterised protein [Brucella suis]|nr:Uncharacterised protein [Brucella suis]